MGPRMREQENYFNHDADVGVIGRGETIELSFANAAYAMFSLMADISNLHQIHIITFEFEEADDESALIAWLNILLVKAKEHHMIFGDFRLKRENNLWKAIVTGEPWRNDIERGVAVKGATQTMLSVQKVDHSWESRCVVDL